MIIDLQRRLAEIGRIRIGAQVAAGNGTRPTKLDTFRLTSPNRDRITAAAQRYGGTPNKWTAPAGQQWEVITTTDTLPVFLPPSDMSFTQNYELWAAGGCSRRCDGTTETISDGPCLCDPEQRECAIHTRLSVMLRDLAGLGVWRIDTQGFYAAVELQAAVEIVNMATHRGTMLPATLRLEQRMTKRPGQVTRRFAVPVLDIEVSPGQLIAGAAHITEIPETVNGGGGPAAITGAPPDAATSTTAPPPPLTPIPADTRDRPSIAAQVDAANKIKRNRRAGTVTLPATGLQPHTTDTLTITTHLGDEPEHITDAQLKKLSVLLRAEGLDDHDTAIAWLSAAIGRDISSRKDLTLTEAGAIIDVLEAPPGG